MRIHHLNCISTCPLGGRLMDGRSSGLRGKRACRCVLVESATQLVLIDTGVGLRDVATPAARLSKFFLQLLDPDFREELTAIRQIEALGFDARDVGHIVLTHLDFDHAGGLDDFPHARVHILHSEAADAVRQAGWLDRHEQRVHNQQRLRELVRDHGSEVKVICSHDPRELELDSGRPLDVPPSPRFERHELELEPNSGRSGW